MYRFTLLLIALVIILLHTGAAQATLDADSTYWFPKAEVPPVIDGEMDPVWYCVSNLLLEKLVTGYTIDDWFDVWGKVKLLWDDSNLYLFIDVHDDVIQPEAVNTWEQDGIELYFDADNSKMETFDTLDDIQLRFNTQWVPDGIHPETGFGTTGEWPSAPFARSGIDWAFKFTEFGYALESVIPLTNLMMEGTVGWDFGFEVQINDNDGDARSAEWKWWSSSGNSWQNPSIWGSAGMDYMTIDGKLPIIKSYIDFVIDGIMEESWSEAPVFSGHNYVTQTAYIPDAWNIYERLEDWKDAYFDFRIMYGSYCFYLFANVYDDIISTEAGEDWEKDGIEFYFDGDNSKNDFTNEGIPYDDNDRHYRQVFSDIPTNDCACQVTKSGWTMEWRIPYSELGWTPEWNSEFGFDVQLNDQDDPALLRSSAMRWWGNDNNASLDASMFGTAYIPPVCDSGCDLVPITCDATDITETSCRLNGIVHNGDSGTMIKFQYGLTSDYDKEITAIHCPIIGNITLPVFAELTDLLPNTTYHYRVNAFQLFCDVDGEDKTFTTSSVLPVVHSLPATEITSTTALLQGEVDIKETPATVTFQYGRWIDYGNEIPAFESPLTNTGFSSVKARLTSLFPNLTYYYRVVTTSTAGTAYSRYMTFTTLESTDIAPTMPVPQQFSLQQNFPNPANPVTNIVYELPVGSNVNITVYNLKGELVRTLYTGAQGPGRYPLLWDGADESGAQVASGLYFLRMDADGFTDMKKIMLIK
ncbi:MAG TPA: sugar-binding protein [bacterium]|nr:sugar-binding protein [bacterium]HPN42998.1 sugar-binding protein [bacterium]